MPSFYDTDFANHHNAVVARDFGHAVTYQRASGGFIPLTAVPKRRDYTIQDEDGLSTSIESWDWEITAALLGLEPRAGDEIRDGSQVFEVMPIGDEKESRPLDSLGAILLVHSKKVQ
jgi:hypothetical protein